ncbi:MAG: hypothetical protein Roseis2KO_26130 [Roseivirga sp.]
MIQFVQATIADMQQVLTFMEAFYAIDGYDFEEERARANAENLISNEHLGRLWLLKLYNEPVGYLALTFGFSFEYGGRDAFIDELYLDEAFRNRGYGTKILQQLDAEAGALDIKAIHLEVEGHNHRGKRLYKKSGFASNDRTLMTRRLGN